MSELQNECRLDPWVRKISWRRKWQAMPVFLPWKSHGQRSLAGYSQSTGSQRVGQNFSNLAAVAAADCSPPGSSVHGILQARILEWVAFPFSRGSSRPRDQTQVSHTAGRCFTIWATRKAQFSSVQSLCCVQLFATPWTVAYQAPLSMGFSKQEY